MRISSGSSLKKLSKNFGNSCHHPSRVSSRFQRGGLKKNSNFLPLANLITFPNQHRSSKINFFPRKIRLLFIMKSEINAYKRKKKFDLPSRWNKLAWTGSNSHLESWADLFGNLPKQTADVYILFLSLLLLSPSPRHFQFRGSIFAAAKKTACATLRKKEFCQQSYKGTKGRGKAFHIGSRDSRGFVFRIGGERELDGRGVFQYLRRCFEQLRMKFVALLVENKGECFEEWFIFGCNVHFYSYR